MDNHFCFGCFGHGGLYCRPSSYVLEIIFLKKQIMHEGKGIHKNLIRLGLVLGVVILFFVVNAIHKEAVKKNQIQEEIDKLKIEAEKTARENSTLQDKIDFLSSREYMETEARDKLNLKSPDEKMVIVKKNAVREEASSSESMGEAQKESGAAMTNRTKWWNYFFKY